MQVTKGARPIVPTMDSSLREPPLKAYGVFDTIYGVAWMAASVVLGLLYDHFIWGLIAISIAGRLASITIFFAGARNTSSGPN
jgi:hypothetical protein